MKARQVKGLHPEGTLADNAERVIGVRLDELCSFVPAALDPDEQEALHDMRIAAKRLRYLLELTGFCFGSYAEKAARQVRELQDVIGEIHDCDVLIPMVLDHIAELRAADARRLAESAGKPGRLEPKLAETAPGRAQYRGLELLVVHHQARRQLYFKRFVKRWKALERAHFRRELRAAVAQRTGTTEPARNGQLSARLSAELAQGGAA